MEPKEEEVDPEETPPVDPEEKNQKALLLELYVEKESGKGFVVEFKIPDVNLYDKIKNICYKV